MPPGNPSGRPRVHLVRPGLVAQLDAALRTSALVLLRGPGGSGRTVALGHWAQGEGHRWLPPRSRATGLEIVADALDLRLAPAPGASGPVAVVVALEHPDLEEILRVLLASDASRDTAPDTARIVVVLLGSAASSRDVARLGRLTTAEPLVVDPRAFLLTSAEIEELAQQRGLEVSVRDVALIRSSTGGHVASVVALLDRATAAPQGASSWSRESVLGLADRIGHRGLARLVPPDLSALLERLAPVESVPTTAASALARELGSPLALRDLIDGGLVVLDPTGAEAPAVPAVRGLLLREGATPSVGEGGGTSVDDLVRALWSGGHLHRAVDVLESRSDRVALVRHLTAHEAELDRLDATRLANLLSDRELTEAPALAVRVARALVDLTHAGHRESVSQAVARRAELLVERSGVLDDGDPSRRAVAGLVLGVAARVQGEHGASTDRLTQAVALGRDGGIPCWSRASSCNWR